MSGLRWQPRPAQLRKQIMRRVSLTGHYSVATSHTQPTWRALSGYHPPYCSHTSCYTFLGRDKPPSRLMAPRYEIGRTPTKVTDHNLPFPSRLWLWLCWSRLHWPLLMNLHILACRGSCLQYHGGFQHSANMSFNSGKTRHTPTLSMGNPFWSGRLFSLVS